MDVKGSGVFGGGRGNHLEATTRSKADALLGYVGSEGEMASAGKSCSGCRGLQGQPGSVRAEPEEDRGDAEGPEKRGKEWVPLRTYMRVQVTMTGECMQGLVGWPPMDSQQKVDNGSSGQARDHWGHTRPSNSCQQENFLILSLWSLGFL